MGPSVVVRVSEGGGVKSKNVTGGGGDRQRLTRRMRRSLYSNDAFPCPGRRLDRRLRPGAVAAGLRPDLGRGRERRPLRRPLRPTRGRGRRPPPPGVDSLPQPPLPPPPPSPPRLPLHPPP